MTYYDVSLGGCGPIANAQYIQDPIIMEHQTLPPEHNHINFPKFLINVTNFTHFVRENKLMKLLFIYPVPLLNTDKIRILSYKLL